MEVVVQQGGLVIRRMLGLDADYGLMVTWRNRPHVRHWWDPDDPPLTIESARAEYAQDISEDSKSTACIVELDDRPIGFIQFYRWGSYPEDAEGLGLTIDPSTWGIDQFIGEPDHVGRGVGTRMVRMLCDHLQGLDPMPVVLLTEIDNAAAIRCYEKAGFAKVTQVLDTDTRGGNRVTSWVMTRSPERGLRHRRRSIDHD